MEGERGGGKGGGERKEGGGGEREAKKEMIHGKTSECGDSPHCRLL